MVLLFFFFFFQAEDGIRDKLVTGVQTCALPISVPRLSSKTGAGQPNSEIEQLKQMLADQQRQINELRQALAQQKKETDSIVAASAGSSPAQPASALPGSSFP